MGSTRLASHLKVCQDKKRIEEEKSHPCYNSGINKCSLHHLNIELDCAPQSLPDSKGRIDSTTAKRRALAIQYGQKGLMDLMDRIETAFQSIKIDKLVEVEKVGSYRSDYSESILIPPEYNRYTDAASRGERPTSERHALQQASIIGNMIKEGLINFNELSETNFIEFGAGKGYLTCMLHDIVPRTKKFVLLDTGTFTKAADRSLRDTFLRRVRMDVADFDVSKIGYLWNEGCNTEQKFVAYAKHLCGVATDYALRCCLHYSKHRKCHEDSKIKAEYVKAPMRSLHFKDRNNQGTDICTKYIDKAEALQDLEQNVSSEVRNTGFAIATCCHHRCNYNEYVGKEILKDLGFSPYDSELICWMSGWAHCHHDGLVKVDASTNDLMNSNTMILPHGNASPNPSRFHANHGKIQNEEPSLDFENNRFASYSHSEAFHYQVRSETRDIPWSEIPRQERARIGMLCKRILDYGRAEFMKKVGGYSVKLVSFCGPEISGENTLLIGCNQTEI